MSKQPRFVAPHLHELEREVMEETWRLGEASVHDVLTALNERTARKRAYTTIMTIMARLNRKGMLARRRDSRAYIYRPTMSRKEHTEARARDQVDALVEDFGDVALAHFAHHVGGLDSKRRAQLRRIARGER